MIGVVAVERRVTVAAVVIMRPHSLACMVKWNRLAASAPAQRGRRVKA